MSVKSFEINQTVDEAYKRVSNHFGTEIVDETVIDIESGYKVVTIAIERYFFRVSNRVGLFVIIDNSTGKTRVKSVATGASESLFFKFDWGASNSFSEEVVDLFNIG